jgi:hypothetical protein
MSAPDQLLRDAGAQRERGWHACALFDGEEEQYRVLLPFARDCIQCGDSCVHFLDSRRQQQRVDRLAGLSIDVDAVSASGQLDLRTWEQSYLRDGRFDQDVMLAFVDELLRAGENAFGRTRLWANMEWVLSRLPGCEQLFEYESRLNVVLDDRKDIVLCVYDAREHNASTLMNVLRTHPFVVVDEALRVNPLYLRPEQFLAQQVR